MRSVDDIVEEYVERAAVLDPLYATYAGAAGHDHELADLSADGFLQARQEAKDRAGDAFSLKDFHSKALSLGSVGLDPLREALAEFCSDLTT